MSFGIKIIVEGDYACFTDPASKVERVSYKVPTPGAVEGILKCVYWKPAIRYVVDELVVFNPITYVNVRRNELKEKVSYQAVKQQMNGRGDPIMYASEQRTQRSAMVLRNVKYGISAHFELTGLKSDHADEDYIFPILDRRIHKTEQQIYDRVRKVLKHVNKALHEWSRLLGLKIELTTYVARHTFATVLKRSGVNIAIISESLGHSDLSTTQIYLDSFENSQIDAAMQNLL